MKQCNPENERIKRVYFEWLRETQFKNSKTINNIRLSIVKFDNFTENQNYKKFNKKIAISFKKFLQKNLKLSPATIFSNLKQIQSFFLWLSYQPGYKSKIKHNDVDYLNSTGKEKRIAQAKRMKKYPTISMIKRVISTMPTQNEIDLRDRALVAFTLLSGMRDSAIISLKLSHVNFEKKLITQDPREVKTKFSKLIYTFFFPVGPEIEKIVFDWITYLREEKLYSDSCPVFPKTKLGLDENNSFSANGLEPHHWETTTPIRNIFRVSFERANFPYYSPHTFRNTLVNLGEKKCESPEEFKVWSQNLGHESPLTTFTSYGHVDEYRQGEILKNLAEGKNRQKSEFLFTPGEVVELRNLIATKK